MSSKHNYSPGPDQGRVPHGDEKHDMEDGEFGKLPAHLESVRDGLLDFNHFIGLQAAMLIDEETNEDLIPLSAYKPDGVGSLERTRESEFVESAQRLAAYAQTIDAQDRYEWHKVFRAVMTERMDSASCGSNMHSSIACTDNETWRALETLDPTESQSAVSTSGLYLGFSIQEANQRAAKGFQMDPSFNNYTRERLAQLSTRGLHCVLRGPSSVDEGVAQTTSKEPQPQLACFPWAIFEAHSVFKSSTENDVSFASAVSQISATASTALSMFERLSKFADEKHEGQHIPPVIAITSIGANTAVWLTYCDIVDDKIRDHTMINIWEGKITKIWDAIQFCRIIDNLFLWAQYCLKPKVTQYLSQWRLRYCPEVPRVHNFLEKDPKTAEMLHQIQDHLSSLGFSPNEDLPALVRQAVVFQGVMRSSNSEIKAGATTEEEKKIPTAIISSPILLIDKSLAVALSSSTEARNGIDQKAGIQENLHQNSDSSAGRNEEGITESSKTNDTNIRWLESPRKHQKPVSILPDKGKEDTGEKSTVLEGTKGEHSIKFLLSCNRRLLTLFFATSTNVLNNKYALNSKSSTFYEADCRGNGKSSFFEPGQIKFSSAEGRYRSLQRPFVSEKFELSFAITPQLDLDMTIPRSTSIHHLGPYPNLGIKVMNCVEYPWRVGPNSRVEGMNLARTPTIVEPQTAPPAPLQPGPLRATKIPWRGRYILVRLPPVSQAPVSGKGNSDSTKR